VLHGYDKIASAVKLRRFTGTFMVWTTGQWIRWLKSVCVRQMLQKKDMQSC